MAGLTNAKAVSIIGIFAMPGALPREIQAPAGDTVQPKLLPYVHLSNARIWPD